MNKLDDKLKEILDETDITQHKDYVIAQIKQAFADEGWIDSKDSQAIAATEIVMKSAYRAGRKMAGQEWYDRFERELSVVNTDGLGNYFRLEVKEAAKRASGIKEETWINNT